MDAQVDTFFGQVLVYETIGVFVGGPLPYRRWRAVRVAEVNLDFQPVGQFGVPRHFIPLIIIDDGAQCLRNSG